MAGLYRSVGVHPGVQTERLAAALFLIVTAPLAVAIAASGGVLALAPLLALVVSILLTGAPPGLQALESVRRLLAGRDQGRRGPGPPRLACPPALRLPGWPVLGPRTGRGPPSAA